MIRGRTCRACRSPAPAETSSSRIRPQPDNRRGSIGSPRHNQPNSGSDQPSRRKVSSAGFSTKESPGTYEKNTSIYEKNINTFGGGIMAGSNVRCGSGGGHAQNPVRPDAL